jgi:Pao retrotransposon peptidase
MQHLPKETHLETKGNMIKTLGITYNMDKDEWSINSPVQRVTDTRRGMLAAMMSFYDPIGITLLITTTMKSTFREICKKHKTWDKRLQEEEKKNWKRVITTLKNIGDVKIPRRIVEKGENTGTGGIL